MAPRTRAFTLIEILTVLAILSVLMALLFPVFAAARGKAREITCISNMRQIGMSIAMYATDYDGMYPYAVDATDKFTPAIWNAFPAFQAQIPTMPMLQDALQPYIKSKQIFQCPADGGYTIEDQTGYPLDATPSSFQKYGTSYNYRTEIAFKHAGDNTFQTPTQLNVLMDAAGRWHGGLLFGDKRYNTLHGDGHARSLTFDQLNTMWAMPL